MVSTVFMAFPMSVRANLAIVVTIPLLKVKDALAIMTTIVLYCSWSLFIAGIERRASERSAVADIISGRKKKKTPAALST